MAVSKKPAALAEALLSVWRQTLVERAQTVTLSGKSYPVRHTPKRNLCQVDFEFDGEAIRGLEQNPQTQSRWAAMARQGARIMQFLSLGRYIANVADGKLTLYYRPSARSKTKRGGS